MSRKNISTEEILRILAEPIPSDYEYNTDIESNDEYEPSEPIELVDR